MDVQSTLFSLRKHDIDNFYHKNFVSVYEYCFYCMDHYFNSHTPGHGLPNVIKI